MIGIFSAVWNDCRLATIQHLRQRRSHSLKTVYLRLRSQYQGTRFVFVSSCWRRRKSSVRVLMSSKDFLAWEVGFNSHVMIKESARAIDKTFRTECFPEFLSLKLVPARIK